MLLQVVSVKGGEVAAARQAAASAQEEATQLRERVLVLEASNEAMARERQVGPWAGLG